MPFIAQTDEEIRLALGLLGLSRSPLEHGLSSAEALVRMVVGGLHPRYWHGVVAWGETTRFLREQLSAMQVAWHEEPELSLPASIVEDGGRSAMSDVLDLPYGPFESEGYQIVVAGGDLATGDARRHPRFANLKGHLMVRAIREQGGELPIFKVGNSVSFQNPQATLDLDGFAVDNSIDPTHSGSRSTWILLVRYGDDGIYAELSKPHSITNSGQVRDWQHRIVLGKVVTTPGVAIPSGDIGPSPEYKGDYGMSDDLDLGSAQAA